MKSNRRPGWGALLGMKRFPANLTRVAEGFRRGLVEDDRIKNPAAR